MDNSVLDDSSSANGNFYCANDDPGVTVVWTFSLAATVTDVDIFTRYKDGGRDGICVLGIDVLTDGGTDWVTLSDSAVEYGTLRKDGNNNSAHNLYAILRDEDGEPLAENVKQIRIHFGQQDNNMTGIGEIEILGCYPPTQAVVKNVTTAYNVFDTLWTTTLSSLGASDTVTVNLLASTDNATWTKVASGVITATETPLLLTNTLSKIGSSVYGAIEVVNTDGVTTWCSTNFPGKVTAADNATYWWKGGTSGIWEDAANWSNSFTNDTRLTYPSATTATASFRDCAEGGPVTVTLGSSRYVKVEPLPELASVTFRGAKSGLQLRHAADSSVGSGYVCRGTNIYDGLNFLYDGGITTRRNALLRLQNGTVHLASGENHPVGVDSHIEVLSGSTFNQNRGGIGGNAQIVISNGTVICASTFVKSHLYAVSEAEGNYTNGFIVLQGETPLFKDTDGHYIYQGGMKTPFTIRFEFPTNGWSTAAYQFGNGHGNSSDGFGGGGYGWRVEVTESASLASARLTRRTTDSREVHLVESLVSGLQMFTNNIVFSAFGVENCWPGRRVNGRGDMFYFTYDNSTALSPSTQGDRPTGLWYHYAGRTYGAQVLVR